ncbi:integrase catalytic domain-containing protein [Trichonephila clavipes]|nr:integrase catalytic domain-containing protein [Trichonephila clavipes]
MCEQLAPDVSLSPTCLPKAVGGMKAKPENSIITIIFLVKHTNQLQSITKWINVTAENLKHCTIHIFCYVIKEVYAAVVFLKLDEKDSVKPSVLAAKSIIAQLRGGKIPRRELLATLIRESLTNSAVEALN